MLEAREFFFIILEVILGDHEDDVDQDHNDGVHIDLGVSIDLLMFLEEPHLIK